MVEIKVTSAAVGTFIVSLVIALLNQISGNTSLLGGLPSLLQFILITVIPPTVAFLSGYQVPSRTSNVSNSHEVKGSE